MEESRIADGVHVSYQYITGKKIEKKYSIQRAFICCIYTITPLSLYHVIIYPVFKLRMEL